MPLNHPWLVGPAPTAVLPRERRGMQVFGTARTLERDDPEAEPCWEAFRWHSDHVERGRSLDDPPTDPITVVTPDRILSTEHWLRRSGYAPRQTWRPREAGPDRVAPADPERVTDLR